MSSCPVCSSLEAEMYCEAADYNWHFTGIFSYRRCSVCGLVYEDNPPEKLIGYYPSNYGRARQKSKHVGKLFALRERFINRHVLNVGTLLDIGCGEGLFLAYMQGRGWCVTGVETAPEHVDYARQKIGLTSIVRGLWPQVAPQIKSSFHVVTLLQTLEHLVDPVPSLAALRELLLPGGIVLIETPNILSWPARLFGPCWAILDAPRHVCLFSRQAIEVCMSKVGLKILEICTNSPSTLAYSESIRYLLEAQGWRRPSKKIERTDASLAASNEKSRPLLAAGKKVLHSSERLIYRSCNFFADHCGRGENLVVVAQRE